MFSVTITSYSRGAGDQVHGHRVDQLVFEAPRRGILRADARGDFAPQARGFQHVGLVHRHQLAAACAGERKARRTTRSIFATV
jgi:hypothetical protein